MCGVLFWAASSLWVVLPCCLREDRQTALWSSKEAPVSKSTQICSHTMPHSLKIPKPSRSFTDPLAAEFTSWILPTQQCQTPSAESSTLTIAVPLVLLFELWLLHTLQLLAQTGLFPHLIPTSTTDRLVDSSSLLQPLPRIQLAHPTVPPWHPPVAPTGSPHSRQASPEDTMPQLWTSTCRQKPN